jgi:membrane-anchored mycosin MYCP
MRASTVIRLAGLLLVGCASAGTLAAPAVASELPFASQQRVSDRGAFLSFTSAPAERAGLCIIDSGVTMNLDLEGVVVDREALEVDGNPADVSPELHGTRMAMEAAAVADNNWGMVGAAPSAVRIVSIRATNTEDALSFNAYKQAILLCEQRAATYNIKVISLSVGFQGTPTPEQLAQLEDAVKDARARFDINVAAAAGNESSTQISYPAAAPSVIAVGASNAQGERCSFSNTGPQLALLAPGCDLEEASPLTGVAEYDQGGSSYSEADAAAVLAALRAYQPGLSAEAAEALMRNTAATAGGVLDVTGLFQAAGLQALIAEGETNEPKAAPAPAPAPVIAPATKALVKHRHALIRPRVQIRRHGKTLLVRLLNLPRGDRVTVMLLARAKHGHRRVLRRTFSSHRQVSIPAIYDGLLLLSYSTPSRQSVSRRASYRLG